MKKVVLIFISLILTFALVSCGDCEFIDANDDGICDECGKGTPIHRIPSDGIDLPEVEF